MIIDLVKSNHRRLTDAVENQLYEEGCAALQQLMSECDVEIDKVIIGNGTWIIEGEDIEVGYEGDYGHESLQDVVEFCMTGDRRVFWWPRIGVADQNKLAEIGHFLEWLCERNVGLEVKNERLHEVQTLPAMRTGG